MGPKKNQKETGINTDLMRYQSILDHLNTLICRFCKDFNLSYANDAFCRRFNQNCEHLIGKSLLDLFPESERQNIQDRVNQLTKTKQAITYTTNPNKEGDSNVTEEWTFCPILNHKGQIEEFQASAGVLSSRPLGKSGQDAMLASLPSAEKENEAILDSLVEHVIYEDPELRILWANQAACDSAGLSRDKIIGRYCYAIWPQRKDPCPDCPVLKAIETGQVQEIEKVTSDGRAWFIRGYPVKNDRNRIVGAVEVTLEITERKQAEEKIDESERRFTAFMDNLPITAFIKDKDQRYIYFNKMMSRIFNASDWMGKSITEIFPSEIADRLDKADRQSYHEGYGVHTHTVPDKKGTPRIWETHTFRIDRQDAEPLLGGFSLDITERKKAEQELQASEERFRTLYENATIGLYRTTPEGEILLANPTLVKMLGYNSFAELAKRNLEVEGYAPGYSRRKFKEQLDVQGQVKGYESSWRRKDGSTIYVNESCRAIRDNNGKVRYYEGTVEDITKRKLAEQELRQSEAKFRTIIQSVKEGIVYTNRRGKILHINKALTEITDIPAHEILGKNTFNVARQYIPKKQVAGILKKVTRAFKGVSLSPFEIEFGQKIIEISAYYDKDTQKITGIIRDITERKQAEEKLRKNEERYRTLVSSMSDIIFLLDKEDRFVDIHCQADSPLFISLEEICGKRHQDIMPDHTNQLYNKAAKNLRKTGKTQRYEYKLQIGKSIKWFNANLDLHEDGKSVIAGIRDITDRKRAEEELRKSEARYRTILENTGVATAIIDKDGILTFVNREFEVISGFKKEEIENKKSWTEFVFQEDLDRMRQYHAGRRKKDTKVPNQYEFRFKDRKGQVKYILITVALIPGTEKSVGSLLNISEQRRLEEQLRKAQKLEAVGKLTGGVAHDFNNLLTVIQGNAELLNMESQMTHAQADLLEQITSASQRAARLTKQLLLFSRKEAMMFAPLDLNDTVTDLLKMLKRLLGEDINIRIDLADDLWIIKGDESNLEQVIMNLALNARDAMPDGGELLLKTKNMTLSETDAQGIPDASAGKAVCLTLEDTGVGMDEQIMDKIFDPFFTTKKTGKGTGLGLSVVYGIVKKHDGWINVYSEKGQGTTFRIYFPFYAVASPAEKKQKVQIEQLQGHNERILLIEDESDVRRFGKHILERNGYQVNDVADAAEALKQFKKKNGDYDLIISDVVLPDINGLELIDQLQAIKGNVPVIMSSGYTEEKSKRRIIVEQNFPFIEKPFNIEEILAVVKKTLVKSY